jgi:hypothetical protein
MDQEKLTAAIEFVLEVELRRLLNIFSKSLFAISVKSKLNAKNIRRNSTRHALDAVCDQGG